MHSFYYVVAVTGTTVTGVSDPGDSLSQAKQDVDDLNSQTDDGTRYRLSTDYRPRIGMDIADIPIVG